MAIPDFRDDGYMPVGVHTATEAEVTFRFGSSGRRRRRLILRLRHWIELGRAVGALRILVDGSFVTSKPSPMTSTRSCCCRTTFRNWSTLTT